LAAGIVPSGKSLIAELAVLIIIAKKSTRQQVLLVNQTNTGFDESALWLKKLGDDLSRRRTSCALVLSQEKSRTSSAARSKA
jgi:hypothetical protein